VFLCRYANILDDVEPLTGEMELLEKAASESEVQLTDLVDAERRLEAKIDGYKREYAELVSEAQSIKAEMAKVKERVGRSTALLQSLDGERARWHRQAHDLGAQFSTLVGDSLVAAAYLAYLGMHDHEAREAFSTSFRAFLSAASIRISEELVLSTYLAKPDERLLWHKHGLPDDDLCTENAVILARCQRYPLLIDPGRCPSIPKAFTCDKRARMMYL
jgi:dynein heavy chain 1